MELAARRERIASGTRARANSSEGAASWARMEDRHLAGEEDGGTEGWRDGVMELWSYGGMEVWRYGVME